MSEFWWNWWVQFAVAIATFLAVVVALWGDKLRAKWFRPSLAVRLLSPVGTLMKVTITPPDGGPSRVEDGRFYHLHVSNPGRWPPATLVQVMLLRIEVRGPDGNLQIGWDAGGEAGGVPLTWTHASIRPLQMTVGPSLTCDLCSIIKGKWVSVSPVFFPSNMGVGKMTSAGTMIVTVQARGTECDSASIRIQIAWDGHWSEGDAEMARHLVISQLDDSGA